MDQRQTVSAECSNEISRLHRGREYDRISPLLRDLQWLRVSERIKFRPAVLAYLARDLQWATADDLRRRLYSHAESASSHKLIVRRSRLTTAGDRAFSVAPPPLWNDFPADRISAQYLSVFKNHLKRIRLTFNAYLCVSTNVTTILYTKLGYGRLMSFIYKAQCAQ